METSLHGVKIPHRKTVKYDKFKKGYRRKKEKDKPKGIAPTGNIRGFNTQTLVHTYKTFIRPVFAYKAVLIATVDPQDIQGVQQKETGILKKIYRRTMEESSKELHEKAKMEK